MRAIIYDQHGPIEGLRLGEVPEPVLAPGGCLVRVRAVSLNGFDPMVIGGIPGLATPLPMIPGTDIAGEIIACGEGVDSRWQAGQRVAVQPVRPEGMMGKTLPGGLCEMLFVPENYLLPVPERVPIEAAACLPAAYATAYRMLVTRGRVGAGETVLILGAGGGIGTAAIQLAKRARCTVIAATDSAAKAERLAEIGADLVIDTTRTDTLRFVHDAFGAPQVDGEGGGVDVCVNIVGGPTWTEGLSTVRRGGRILSSGSIAGSDPVTDLRAIAAFEHTIIGASGWTREDHAAMLDLVAAGEIVPVIDRVVPMTEVRAAMRDLADRKVVGKIVLTID